MPIPAINVPTEDSVDDIYQCESCKKRRNNYFSPVECKTCDGTNNYEPVDKNQCST